jgi:hypothetical protein
MTTENTTNAPRPKSTRKQKIDAIKYIRSVCEDGLKVRDSHIREKFQVANSINILLREKIIEKIENEDCKYIWKSSAAPETIVDAIWTVHGPEKNEPFFIHPIPQPQVQESVKTPQIVSIPVTPSVPVPENSLNSFLQRCLEECVEYGITDIKKQVKYILDRLQSKYNVTKYNP